MFIRAFQPKEPTPTWTYTRFGTIIPQEDTEITTLKEFFVKSPLTEEKLMAAMRADKRVLIETVNDREARESREKINIESSVEYKLEKKNVKEHKKNVMDKKIEEFNEEKEKAMATETKEDDKIVAEKEKTLMKEIKKEADNGKE